MIKPFIVSLLIFYSLSATSPVIAQRVVESTSRCLSGADSANREGLDYLKKGESERALVVLQSAIKIDPRCADLYNNLGTAYELLKRYEEAIKAYQQALLTRNKLNWIYNYNLARAYYALTRYEESVNALSETIRLKPDYEPAYTRRAQLSRLLGQYQQAIQDYTKAISLDKQNPSFYGDRSWLYLYLSQGEAAAADAQRFLELKGWRDKRSIYMILVSHLGKRQAGQVAEAKIILDKFVRQSDFKSWPYPVVQYLRKQISEQELLSMATDNEQRTEARTYIGMDLSLLGKRKEALVHLEWVKENGKQTIYEYALALAELRRLVSVALNSDQH